MPGFHLIHGGNLLRLLFVFCPSAGRFDGVLFVLFLFFSLFFFFSLVFCCCFLFCLCLFRFVFVLTCSRFIDHLHFSSRAWQAQILDVIRCAVLLGTLMRCLQGHQAQKCYLHLNWYYSSFISRQMPTCCRLCQPFRILYCRKGARPYSSNVGATHSS